MHAFNKVVEGEEVEESEAESEAEEERETDSEEDEEITQEVENEMDKEDEHVVRFYFIFFFLSLLASHSLPPAKIPTYRLNKAVVNTETIFTILSFQI